MTGRAGGPVGPVMQLARFSGFTSEEAFYLTFIEGFDVGGLVLAGTVLGTLGDGPTEDKVEEPGTSPSRRLHRADRAGEGPPDTDKKVRAAEIG